MKPGYLILAYFILVNLTAFLLMGIDKHKAKKGAFRISEASLFAPAFLGGAIGSTMGMLIFHHKTNHWYFQALMPLIALLEEAGILIWALVKSGLL